MKGQLPAGVIPGVISWFTQRNYHPRMVGPDKLQTRLESPVAKCFSAQVSK